MGFRSSRRGPDLETVSWPRDADRLAALRVARAPRLVIVASTESAPVPDDELEDWVFLPADPEDIALRSRRLARLAREDSRRRAQRGPSDHQLPDSSAAPGEVDEVRA